MPVLALLLLGCTATEPDSGGHDSAGPRWDFWSEGPALRGSGGPGTAFSSEQLWTPCAFLDGGEQDFDHHNLVVPYRGHLVMPWTPEFGTGGVSLFDMADPCNPVKAGEGWAAEMRESHALGFVHLGEDSPTPGDFMVSTGVLGILTWDLTDLQAPEAAAYLTLPGVFYPDAYTYVVLSVSLQYPWLYVGAADNGVYVVDVTDPRAPALVSQHVLDPPLRVGGVFAMGNLLLVSSAEQSEAALYDISIPDQLQPIPGGRFATADGTGDAVEHYHGNHAGDLALFARKEGGGGVLVYDIADPTRPTLLGDTLSDGNGGYVFYDEGLVFEGESSIARVYDISDPAAITLVGEGDLEGDLDTLTPYGNVAVLSVDDDAVDGQASAVMPWAAEPDATPLRVRRVVPADGETGVATSSRVGVVFDELVEPASVYPGSLRLLDEAGRPVPGWVSVQEATGSYSPMEPLLPGAVYTIEVQGVTDVSGNPMEGTLVTTFTTAG